MHVIDAIRKRRSVRRFLPDAIPEDVADRLMEALRLAPTGGNRQPFKFIVVRDHAVRAQVAAACRWSPGRPKGHDFVAGAPMVVVACGLEKDAVTRYYKDGQASLAIEAEPGSLGMEPAASINLLAVDMAIALDHFSLAATAEGLSTCWIAALDEPELRQVLGIPAEMRALFVMPVGYAAEWPGPRPRKPLQDIICHDRYS